jgi:hypothetical protein
MRRTEIDKYGIGTRNAKPAPKYDWLNLPDSMSGQERHLISLRDEIERDINNLAHWQYQMPHSQYNARLAELYARKRVVAAIFNPHNFGAGSKGFPTISCGWMRSASNEH